MAGKEGRLKQRLRRLETARGDRAAGVSVLQPRASDVIARFGVDAIRAFLTMVFDACPCGLCAQVYHIMRGLTPDAPYEPEADPGWTDAVMKLEATMAAEDLQFIQAQRQRVIAWGNAVAESPKGQGPLYPANALYDEYIRRINVAARLRAGAAARSLG